MLTVLALIKLPSLFWPNRKKENDETVDTFNKFLWPFLQPFVLAIQARLCFAPFGLYIIQSTGKVDKNMYGHKYLIGLDSQLIQPCRQSNHIETFRLTVNTLSSRFIYNIHVLSKSSIATVYCTCNLLIPHCLGAQTLMTYPGTCTCIYMYVWLHLKTGLGRLP